MPHSAVRHLEGDHVAAQRVVADRAGDLAGGLVHREAERQVLRAIGDRVVVGIAGDDRPVHNIALGIGQRTGTDHQGRQVGAADIDGEVDERRQELSGHDLGAHPGGVRGRRAFREPDSDDVFRFTRRAKRTRDEAGRGINGNGRRQVVTKRHAAPIHREERLIAVWIVAGNLQREHAFVNGRRAGGLLDNGRTVDVVDRPGERCTAGRSAERLGDRHVVDARGFEGKEAADLAGSRVDRHARR